MTNMKANNNSIGNKTAETIRKHFLAFDLSLSSLYTILFKKKFC